MLLFDMLLGEVPLYRIVLFKLFIWILSDLLLCKRLRLVYGLACYHHHRYWPFFIMNDMNIIADLQWPQGPERSPILI